MQIWDRIGKTLRLANPFAVASNVLLTAGAGIGLSVLARAYLFTGALPAGACPLTLERPWLYGAIGLLGLSLILSFFENRK